MLVRVVGPLPPPCPSLVQLSLFPPPCLGMSLCGYGCNSDTAIGGFDVFSHDLRESGTIIIIVLNCFQAYLGLHAIPKQLELSGI